MARTTSIGIDLPPELFQSTSERESQTLLQGIAKLAQMGYGDPSGWFTQQPQSVQEKLWRELMTYKPGWSRRLIGGARQKLLEPIPTEPITKPEQLNVEEGRPIYEEEPGRYTRKFPLPPAPSYRARNISPEEVNKELANFMQIPGMTKEGAQQAVAKQLGGEIEEPPEVGAGKKARGIKAFATMMYPGDPDKQEAIEAAQSGLIKSGMIPREEIDAVNAVTDFATKNKMSFEEALPHLPAQTQLYAVDHIKKLTDMQSKQEALKIRRDLLEYRKKRDQEVDKLKKSLKGGKDLSKNVQFAIKEYDKQVSYWKWELSQLNLADIAEGRPPSYPPGRVDLLQDYLDRDSWIQQKFGLSTTQIYQSTGAGTVPVPPPPFGVSHGQGAPGPQQGTKQGKDFSHLW